MVPLPKKSRSELNFSEKEARYSVATLGKGLERDIGGPRSPLLKRKFNKRRENLGLYLLLGVVSCSILFHFFIKV